MAVPERIRWAVETLAVAPDDRILEIGCGRGVAVELICERLTGGRITAIDRSATAIDAATRRNAANVAAGKAVFDTVSLEALLPDGDRFDPVFAINVNLFWTRSPAVELDLIRRLLAPRGVLYLFYDAPSASKAATLTETMAEFGFTATASSPSPTLLCVRASPARGKA